MFSSVSLIADSAALFKRSCRSRYCSIPWRYLNAEYISHTYSCISIHERTNERFACFLAKKNSSFPPWFVPLQASTQGLSKRGVVELTTNALYTTIHFHFHFHFQFQSNLSQDFLGKLRNSSSDSSSDSDSDSNSNSIQALHLHFLLDLCQLCVQFGKLLPFLPLSLFRPVFLLAALRGPSSAAAAAAAAAAPRPPGDVLLGNTPV